MIRNGDVDALAVDLQRELRQRVRFRRDQIVRRRLLAHPADGDTRTYKADCRNAGTRWRYYVESGDDSDVALDIAYVVMELESNSRPDLAGAFLTRFATAAHDFDFYPLLDLYASHRALTRARLACQVATDPTTSRVKASRKAAEASRLLAMAASYI